MFLKHKFGLGNTLKAIKARLVAGGHQQDLSQIDPENISSSTLRTASFNVLLNFAAYHKMDLSIIDIKSAYLHAKLPDDVVIHMTIIKEITAMIVKIDPKALKFVDNKGELTVRLRKALYGLVQSAKLWYDRISEELAVLGYHPLPKSIDPNVFKSENGKFFIGVFVDDLGAVADKAETDRIAAHLTSVFGPLKFQTGDKLSWLGIDIVRDIEGGSMTLSQTDFIERSVEKFKKILKVNKFEESNLPASDDLFRTANQDFKQKDLNLPMLSIVMSIAYLSQRTRPDLQCVVSYFTTRSYHHDPKDMEKLKKLIGYIIKTRNKVLTFSPTELRIYCMSDASYGIHAKNESHTGI